MKEKESSIKEKVKESYKMMIVVALATFFFTQTVNISNSVKYWLTYPIFNSELDSLQTNQIDFLTKNQVNFCTIEESRSVDSVIFIKLEEIRSNQLVFQNSVIKRYDIKCDMLTNNQKEIIGVLKAMRLINIGYCDTTSMPAGLTYTSE